MIYEFECIQCLNKIEIIQKIKDPPPLCSRCSATTPMKKLISLSSFQLLGEGWAKDLYTKHSKNK